MSGSKDDDKGGFVVGGITFGTGQPDPSGQKRGGPVELGDTLLPLRVVVVADLVPSGSFNAGARPPEEPIAIDPGDFDGLFKRLRPKAAIEIESVVADGKRVRVDFAPTSMKSFRPDGLARDIPVLKSLLDGRRVLEQLRDGTQTVEGATAELSRLWPASSLVARVLGGVELKPVPGTAPAAPPPKAASPDVDALLGMVDIGTPVPGVLANAPAPAPEPAPAPIAPAGDGDGRFGAFIAAVAHSGKTRGSASPAEGLRIVEKAFNVQLGAFLQHPEIRRLEQVWSGLAFLASRTPKSGAKLEVICAGGDDAPRALERAIHHAEGISPPVSFAVVDVAVDGKAAAFARLRQLADIAEASTVPVLTNATAGIFGGTHLDEIDRLDNKQGLFDAPERAPWRAEANRPAMLWVALGINRVLLRSAYDKKTSRVREAPVEELPSDEAAAAVWMDPCWAVASLAVQSFGKTGWPCRITGAREGGVIEDLQVREVSVSSYEGSERIAIPTEVFFSTETQRALGRIGILGVASQPNSDSCYLMSAATAYVPPPKRTHDYDTAEDQVRLPQASLVDQLFVARLCQFLQAIGAKIGADNPPRDIEKVLEASLWELFGSGPNGMEIQVNVADQGGKITAAVTVRPRRFLGVSMEEITLGVPLA